jgi:hypothetical protein
LFGGLVVFFNFGFIVIIVVGGNCGVVSGVILVQMCVTKALVFLVFRSLGGCWFMIVVFLLKNLINF